MKEQEMRETEREGGRARKSGTGLRLQLIHITSRVGLIISEAVCVSVCAVYAIAFTASVNSLTSEEWLARILALVHN